jgi:hypothetical protein
MFCCVLSSWILGVQDEMQSWQYDNAFLISKLGGSWVQQGPGMAALFSNPLAAAAAAANGEKKAAALAAGHMVFGSSDSTAVVAIATRRQHCSGSHCNTATALQWWPLQHGDSTAVVAIATRRQHCSGGHCNTATALQW